MISTGIRKLDEYLNGGIRDCIITDIFGQNSVGKTQLALQICVNAITDDSIVVYQDATGNFRPERIIEFMKAKNMNKKLLDQIKVGKITNVGEQIQYINTMLEIQNLNLVIIDTVTDLFSFEYSKESSSLTKHVEFMKYMHKLAFFALQKQIPVVVTNTTRKSDEMERENLDRSISMFTHQKIHLVKNNGKHTAIVLPSFGESKNAEYDITRDGVFGSS